MSENVTTAWHSPEEMPRESGYCVVAYEDVFGMCYAVACMSNGVWFSTDDNWPRRKRIAAWMPIPEYQTSKNEN